MVCLPLIEINVLILLSKTVNWQKISIHMYICNC